MQAELRNRLLFGPMLAGAVISCLIWDLRTGHHYGLLGTLILAGILAGFELRQMSRLLGARIPIGPPLITSLFLLLWYFGAYDHSYGSPWLAADLRQQPIPAFLISLGFIWMCLVHMARKGSADFTRYVGMGMLCLGYLGVCGALELYMGCLPDRQPLPDLIQTRGSQLVLLHIVTCKIGDIFAYFGGRAWGRHKLCPAISPGKTWEGFLCALAGATLLAWAFAEVLGAAGLPRPFSAWWSILVWGVVLGCFGVLGDLVESCLKRDAGVKDSSQVVPGFGGFLDLFDALILSAPIACLLALFLP